jgi:hypothetical protein
MSEDKKIPNLNLTPEELAELLKNIKLEDLLPIESPKPQQKFYNCNLCHDTKKVLVCGGPNRDCPVCGPRY